MLCLQQLVCWYVGCLLACKIYAIVCNRVKLRPNSHDYRARLQLRDLEKPVTITTESEIDYDYDSNLPHPWPRLDGGHS